MKLVVFSGSDSEGVNLPDPLLAWPSLICQGLEGRFGEPVALVHRRLYVHVGDPAAYVDHVLTEHRPDFVIMACNGVSWAWRTVPTRIRKVLGARAGDWAEARMSWFDAGAPSNRLVAAGAGAVHWTVRHTIPVAAHLPRGEAECRWLALIDRLAREEDAEVLVTGTIFLRGELARAAPGVNAQITDFNAVLESRTRERHLLWFDREPLLSAMTEEEGFLGDRVHRTATHHQQMATAMLTIFARDATAAAAASSPASR
jgi:hypothetical protein